MSVFPRLAVGEFAPLFRMLDDYASHHVARSIPAACTGSSTAVSHYQPKFDIKESKSNYELHGELPGVAQRDVDIEFTDAQTLKISGRSSRSRTTETPASAPQDDASGAQANSQVAPKATVEDDFSVVSASDANEHAQPPTNQVNTADKHNSDAAVQNTKQSQSRYWLSERSVGQFQRTFNFPDRIDQDNVNASMRDGILSIVVPKAQPPAKRRINIE